MINPSENTFTVVQTAPDDAVTVHLFAVDGETLGDVSWPDRISGAEIQIAPRGHLTVVPEALNRAITALSRVGLNRIVILFEDEDAAWDYSWGRLQTEE